MTYQMAVGGLVGGLLASLGPLVVASLAAVVIHTSSVPLVAFGRLALWWCVFSGGLVTCGAAAGALIGYLASRDEAPAS